MKLVLKTVATEASSCFVLINGLFDEAQIYGIKNLHVNWVITRKALIEILNICPHCFNFHIQLINCSIWLKAQQMPFQYLQPLMCWNKLLKKLRKSYRQQLNFQCVLRPVSEFTSNLLYQKSSNYRPDLKILVLNSNLRKRKLKKPWLRESMSQEPLKCTPHLKRYLLILGVKCLSGVFSQQNFKPHSELWTRWTVPLVFNI